MYDVTRIYGCRYTYVHCEQSITSLSRQTRLALGKTLRYYGAWLVNPSTGRVTQIGFPGKEETERERDRQQRQRAKMDRFYPKFQKIRYHTYILTGTFIPMIDKGTSCECLKSVLLFL